MRGGFQIRSCRGGQWQGKRTRERMKGNNIYGTMPFLFLFFNDSPCCAQIIITVKKRL